MLYLRWKIRSKITDMESGKNAGSIQEQNGWKRVPDNPGNGPGIAR